MGQNNTFGLGCQGLPGKILKGAFKYFYINQQINKKPTKREGDQR
jgi:hypothetical protein